MSICMQCATAAQRSREVFTQTERIFILTAVALMMRQMESTATTPSQDKVVGSSVTAKMLLSFPPPTGEALLRKLRDSAGVDIKLGSCPHGLSVLS